MDGLGDLFAPYTDEIAKFAGIVTCLQFLSGAFLLNDVRRRGCSDAFPPDPLIGGVVLTVLSLKLGSLMGDMAMIKVNIIGFAINVVFMAIFYWYASNQHKTRLWAKMGIAGIFTMACLAYANFEDAKKIEFRFGMLLSGILVVLVGSPLLSLGDIIQKKSTESLPFPFVLSGTVVAASWLLYGISISNSIMIYQNLFLFCLSFAQLMLIAIFRNKSASTKDQENLLAGNMDKKND